MPAASVQEAAQANQVVAFAVSGDALANQPGQLVLEHGAVQAGGVADLGVAGGEETG